MRPASAAAAWPTTRHAAVRRKYGKNRISLAKRAAHPQGWQTIECTAYGKTTTKTYKTFLATYEPVGGVIRVVIVKEDHDWFPFFSTDPAASVVEIIEAFADRATIEQDFHDVKEVWGAGQQQVRNIWTNVAVYHLNLWMHTLVELWAWNRRHAELCDRSDFPMGRSRTPSFSCGSSQSLTQTHPTKRIIGRSPLFGRCREKSSGWPDASWRWPLDLSPFVRKCRIDINSENRRGLLATYKRP